VDRFVIVYASELTQEDLNEAVIPEFRKMPIWGPKLVGLRLPTDPKEQFRLIQQSVSGGREAEKMPRYYTLYSKVAVSLTKRGKDPRQLTSRSKGGHLGEWLRDHALQSYVYLPLVGRTKSTTLLVDEADATPVRGFDIDPW
jgi:hypothetical protein